MNTPQNLPDNVKTVLGAVPPLSHERGDRELTYQYSIGGMTGLLDEEAEWAISELAKRGVGVITYWQQGAGQDASVTEDMRIAKIQQRLGLTIAVDANSILHRFYDTEATTAHIDSDGQPFWDESFAGNKMGCPFALEHRKPVILSRVAAHVEAYYLSGLTIGIATADWEIDGPHEWNQAWEHSKRCSRCKENLSNIDDFTSFQATMRQKRAELLRDCYSTPILNRFPKALVTNYAVYPNDGWRYWYDYFETRRSDLPHRLDQQFMVRPWYNDFTETGFTLAMPVVYTWGDFFNSFPEFSDPDYRWFYSMLSVGSNAAKSTPSGIPIATFVHWHTTTPSPDGAEVPQMSKESYSDLLWHLLLRGHDILYSWTPMEELSVEIALIQEVYDASLEYNEFIAHGTPITFDVPTEQGPVVSGLRLGDRVLIRRTDFGGNTDPMTISIGGDSLTVNSAPGECVILPMP
ncbi:MAG: hypothetical protein QGH20_04340 [Candidatus Latescibacteria bacterium]|jgi:hypothetical protein|nr:hypothetical protein [Candidatus Latescibacterota bacterium]